MEKIPVAGGGSENRVCIVWMYPLPVGVRFEAADRVVCVANLNGDVHKEFSCGMEI